MPLSLSIDPCPSYRVSRDENRWADYIELTCLVSIDKEVSLSDLLETYRLQDAISPLDQESYIEDGLSADWTGGESKDFPKNIGIHASLFDKMYARFCGYFEYLNYRSVILPESYPFVIENNTSLILKPDFNHYQKLYLFLLLASNTNCFTEKERHYFTHAFEDISCSVLRLLSPQNAIVEVFGTSRDRGRYCGNLRERMISLAKDFESYVAPNVMIDRNFCVPAGDGGLDLVAYHAFDGQPFIPISFAQCACSYKDWETKQDSIARNKWRERIMHLPPYLEYTFVPFFFRDTQGVWESRDDIRTCLIDRYRFINTILNSSDEKILQHLMITDIDNVIGL